MILAAFLMIGFTAVHAQQTDTKVEETKTTTIPQKVHNVVHPKHKKYSGYKVKKKTAKGKKYVKKVDHTDHTVKVKTKDVGAIDKKVTTTSTK